MKIIHPFPPSLQISQFSPYIVSPNFFSQNNCSRIKAAMKGGFRAKIEGAGDGREEPSIRGTTVYGIEPTKENQWLFEKLSAAVIQCNFETYGYDLSGFCEGIQISRYHLGDHYDWHMDIGSKILSQRKLSVVAQLSDPSEYEGGELEFFKNGDAPKDQGSLILFPSFMFHRVRAITKGVRHSLVAWVSGTPYK